MRWLLLVVLFSSSNAFAVAQTGLVTSLSGIWDDVDNFVTVGQCAAAPNKTALYLCHPAKLSFVKKGRLDAGGYLSATDSVLEAADTLRKEKLSTTDIDQMFKKYNYSEFLVSTRISYVQSHFYAGVRPIRAQGQFQIHNPNLPSVSLTYREDLHFFTGLGFSLDLKSFNISIGAQGTLIQRKEILSEANLVDFASKSPSELISKQNLQGAFADAGAIVEIPHVLIVSSLFKDIGYFWKGQDLSQQFLFVTGDKIPRMHLAAALTPSVWVGSLQVGAEMMYFLQENNRYKDQWFGTVSFFAGPLRILSGFRKGFFRTGLALAYNNIEVSVAQEWVNHLEEAARCSLDLL